MTSLATKPATILMIEVWSGRCGRLMVRSAVRLCVTIQSLAVPTYVWLRTSADDDIWRQYQRSQRPWYQRSQRRCGVGGVSTSRVAPAHVDEYITLAASYATPAPWDKYITRASSRDAAPAPVVGVHSACASWVRNTSICRGEHRSRSRSVLRCTCARG